MYFPEKAAVTKLLSLYVVIVAIEGLNLKLIMIVVIVVIIIIVVILAIVFIVVQGGRSWQPFI